MCWTKTIALVFIFLSNLRFPANESIEQIYNDVALILEVPIWHRDSKDWFESQCANAARYIYRFPPSQAGWTKDALTSNDTHGLLLHNGISRS